MPCHAAPRVKIYAYDMRHARRYAAMRAAAQEAQKIWSYMRRVEVALRQSHAYSQSWHAGHHERHPQRTGVVVGLQAAVCGGGSGMECIRARLRFQIFFDVRPSYCLITQKCYFIPPHR